MSNQTSQYLQAWKARTAPRELELSDGFRVLIRPVEVMGLLLSGRIPMTLLRQMQDIQPGADGNYTPEDTIKMVPAIDAVVLAAVVDPPVTLEGGENSIAVGDIPLADRMAIFEEVNRPAAAMQPFRGQPDGDAVAAPVSQDLREAAE